MRAVFMLRRRHDTPVRCAAPPPVPACLFSKRQLQAAIADRDCERDNLRLSFQRPSSNRATNSRHDIAPHALDDALRVGLATLASEWFAAGLDLLREGLRRPGSAHSL
jgi:hypothetical protein